MLRKDESYLFMLILKYVVEYSPTVINRVQMMKESSETMVQINPQDWVDKQEYEFGYQAMG